MRGDYGQKCPDCGGPMELNENKAVDGRLQYALACTTHGRHTEWYLNRASALTAPVLYKRVPHSAPLSDEPAPEPVAEAEPTTGKQIVEKALAERTGEQT